MKKKRIKVLFTATLAMVLTVALPLTVMAKQDNKVNGGGFTNLETLTWTANDGTVTAYGRGPRFCDVYPEITDPEYFLKEMVRYQGEEVAPLNSKGQPKSDYGDEVLAELKVFVNSFDWIHADELTRANMVHDRVSNGYHGNTYNSPQASSFSVLLTGTGQCGDFSSEFQRLAKYVGLECEVYDPSYMHQACLIKISGQWFATDPTSSLPFLSNSKTHPVDYETEYNRYDKELEAEQNAFYAANPDSSVTLITEAARKTADGFLTDADWAKVDPLFAEIEEQRKDNLLTPEEYEKKNVEVLKLLLGK